MTTVLHTPLQKSTFFSAIFFGQPRPPRAWPDALASKKRLDFLRESVHSGSDRVLNYELLVQILIFEKEKCPCACSTRLRSSPAGRWGDPERHLRSRPGQELRSEQLCGQQGRGHRPDQGLGAGAGPQQHPGQRGRPGAPTATEIVESMPQNVLEQLKKHTPQPLQKSRSMATLPSCL